MMMMMMMRNKLHITEIQAAGGELPSIIAQLNFLSHNSSNRPVSFAIKDAESVIQMHASVSLIPDGAYGGSLILEPHM